MPRGYRLKANGISRPGQFKAETESVPFYSLYGKDEENNLEKHLAHCGRVSLQVGLKES